jgi:uncharacterized Rmd1/YagE family protein
MKKDNKKVNYETFITWLIIILISVTLLLTLLKEFYTYYLK